MDLLGNESVTTPESLLLKKIEDELTVISEEQHAWARQAAILREARTLLHVGGSTLEVSALLAEQRRKEQAKRTSFARTTSG
jgi:hypothetical protein